MWLSFKKECCLISNLFQDLTQKVYCMFFIYKIEFIGNIKNI